MQLIPFQPYRFAGGVADCRTLSRIVFGLCFHGATFLLNFVYLSVSCCLVVNYTMPVLMLPFEGPERLGILDEVYFCEQLVYKKIFSVLSICAYYAGALLCCQVWHSV